MTSLQTNVRLSRCAIGDVLLKDAAKQASPEARASINVAPLCWSSLPYFEEKVFKCAASHPRDHQYLALNYSCFPLSEQLQRSCPATGWHPRNVYLEAGHNS